ncbi:MAG TPA: cytidylate kinase-like family protein [Actinotalea sp.]|jgi:glucuronide carrier protein
MSQEASQPAAQTAGTPSTSGTATPPVVTLFEQFGAGADHVGRKVADALGLPFNAQAFSSEAIESSAQSTEENATLVQVFAAMGGAYGGLDGREVASTQRQKYELVMDNNTTVQAMAAAGGVIVGRNATVILAERPATVHVLLTGKVEDRVARAAQEAGIPLERAAERQRREDQVRAQMSQTFYGWDPREAVHYDLVFNTSRIDLDRVVDAILVAIDARSAS